MTNAFDSLLDKAKEIRDAVYEGENTAERVGSMFVELLTAASKALYGADGADTLLRKLSAKGLLTPGDALAVEHKGTSAKINIPTVTPDGTPGTASAVIGAVGVKAGLMLPAHVETINDTAATLAALVERLAELPVVDFDAVSHTSLPAAPWPGEISTLGCTFRVIYGENFGQFLLEVSTIRGSDTARYTSWDEIRASDGKVLARPSTDYNDYDEESGTFTPLSGRLFHRAGTASLPAAFYAWDGESLREVNSFAGSLASLSGSIETLSSALGLHTSRLDRHEERLGDLVYKTNKLRTETDALQTKADELQDNLHSAARMALDALNQSDDNAEAVGFLQSRASRHEERLTGLEQTISGLPQSSGFIQGLLSGSFPSYLATNAAFASSLASAPGFIDNMAAGLVSHLDFNNNLASSSNFLAALSVSLSANSGFIGALSRSHVLAHDLGETMATGSGLPLRLASNPTFTDSLAANSGFVGSLSRQIASSTGFVSPFISALTGNASAMATLKSALGL